MDLKNPKVMETRFISDYNDGASLEILGEDNNTYLVQFRNLKNGEIIHQTESACNHWTKTSRKYFTDWRIDVFLNGVSVFSDMLDCHKKDVLVLSDSKALGDNIPNSPYLEEFRKKYDCNLTVASKFWWFFKDYYPNIKWIDTSAFDIEREKQYATYNISVGVDLDVFNSGVLKYVIVMLMANRQ